MIHDIRPEVLEEVEDCIRQVKTFQAAQGRRIHKAIKRSRKGGEQVEALKQIFPTLPDDFLALYHHHNGAEPGASLSMWEWSVFLEFEWSSADLLVRRNKIMRLDKDNPLVDRFDTFHSPEGQSLQLDPGAEKGGAVPMLMTLGTLSRNAYIAFESTLALLRSVCAVQQAGILHYVKKGQRIHHRDGTPREIHDIYYDAKELWDVIQPFNSRADYWPALLKGALEWDEIEVELPQNGILNLDPEVRRLIVGTPEEYQQATEEEMRQAGFTEDEIRRARDAED